MFLDTKNMGLQQYIKDTVSEMKHVSWPTRRQTLVYTALVIGISIVVAAYVGLLDAFFAKMLNLFIS